MQTTTLTGPDGIELVLDRSKIHADDPGEDTPALVRIGEACASLAYAIGEGELLSTQGALVLQEDQLEWLCGVESGAERWLAGDDSTFAVNG